MIKITTIFGEDAVREYEENNELPSEEWLADNGGVVDEKEFETEAEYNAYIAGVNDADGWSDYHIIRHRSEEADTSREENLWLRLGISVRGSREEILKVHARKVALAPGIDFNTVARMASGASGAELANIVNEAALRAVRAGRKSVTEADLEESIEVVIAGYQKKNSILTDKEKCIVAYHEIGHALVAALQNHSAPVQKITIIPRTSGALGYTMQVEEGNHYLMTKEELENKIATLTGGRAAEEVVFGSITTGASNDIEQATKLARAMLTRYGYVEDAMKMITKTEAPSWGYWVETMGYTTLPETWTLSPEFRDASLNHVFMGDVSAWMMNQLAGINYDAVEPGFRHILITPHFVEGMDWVKGEYHSVRGLISSEWKREGGKVTLTVTIPSGCTADIRVGDKTETVGSGTHVKTY